MFSRSAALVTSLLALTACAQQDDASPYADPGPFLSGQPGQSFQFDGSASIADSWAWSLLAIPPDSKLGAADLLDADSPWLVLVPDVGGRYALLLEVCTGAGACDERSVSAVLGSPATLAAEVEAALRDEAFDEDPLDMANLGPHRMVHDNDPVEFRSKFGFIRRKGNHAPVAIASAWQSTGSGGTVTLDGEESYDPDGDDLRYRWSFASIPAASSLDSSALSSPNGGTAAFTPDVPGVWVLRLTVRDNVDRAATTVLVEVD